jgi:1,4-dihydroxy-2-naphthoyl-CoA hydrolase
VNDDVSKDTDALRAQWHQGWDAAMKFRFVQATRDEVVIEYQVDAVHCQAYGIVHGGVHCGAIEAACSTGAAIDAMARGQSVVGVENHTSFIRAVRTGRVQIRATPITRGRRSQVWEATARDEAGQILSTGRVRLLCLDAGTALAGETVSATPRS